MIRVAQAISVLCVVLVFSPYALSQGSNISEGEELFDRYCAGCHGNSGVGQVPEDPGGGWDADGMRVAPSLNSKGHSWHHSPEMLFMYIKEGSVDDTSPMPSFGAILKDAEVESLVLYVESLWSKEIRKKHRERFGEHPHIFKEER